MVIAMFSGARGALPADNAPRFDAATGHVESWFWRANHPTQRKAVWIKATVLAPLDGEATADVWCIVFNGGNVIGRRATIALNKARFGGDPLVIDVAAAHFSLDPQQGCLTGGLDELEWNLSFRPTSGPLARPLCLFPSRRLLAGPIPRNKTVTPSPSLTFDGTLKCRGTTWKVASWPGMQGHNWGPAHAEQYAWGQCLFAGSDGPAVMVEGVSARVRIGGVSRVGDLTASSTPGTRRSASTT